MRSVAPRVTAETIRSIAPLVDTRFTQTPLAEFDSLNEALSCRMLLKIETLNPIRCFKGRGASAFVRTHALDQPDTPLVAASAGNWGQALALAGTDAGIPVTVYAATTANPTKIERMRALGAEVILHGDDFDAAKAEARRHAAAVGGRLAEDGAHTEVTAGHGTCAIEIAEQADVDSIVVPLGNGALVNGIGAWFADTNPQVEIIAVSASGAPAMHDSFTTGRVIETASVDTVADGLAVRTPVPEALDDMRHGVDRSMLVNDARLRAAQSLVLEHTGLVTEPSGAAGVAALLEHPPGSDQTVVAVVTGSNIDRGESSPNPQL